MKGWKTWVGGVGLILTGAGMVLTGILEIPRNWDNVEIGIQTAAAGLALIGIGHKIEKCAKGG